MTRLMTLALIAPALLALALSAPALACGGVFSPIEAEAATAFETQTVLIHRTADRLDVHLRMTIAPGAERFSWVLPAPPDATLALGDDALFDALDAMTRPVITIENRSSGGGCSEAASDGGRGGVDVEEIGRIGEYDYAVIAAADASAAVAWLTDNGFAVPAGAAAAMQPYADAGLDFIGIRLARPDPDAVRPTPLVISTADTTGELPLYPLGMSRLSVAGMLPVLIYVLGPERAAVTSAESTTVVELADLIRSNRYLSYEDAIDFRQDEASGPLWVTDAVIINPDDPAITALGGAVLTRLSARLPEDRVQDAVLGWHPSREPVDPLQHRTVGSDESCAATGSHAPIWTLLLLLGALRLRRRR